MKDLKSLMLTFLFTASLLWVNSVINFTTLHENHRRQLGSWKDLETGYIPQYHLVPFTSRPNLPFIMKQLLLNRTELAWNISDLKTTGVKTSVQDFFKKYGSNSEVKERLHEGLNMKFNEGTLRKSLHSLSTTDETLEDLVDIVIPITTTKEATLSFLESWKTTIKDLHVILIYAEIIAFDSASLPTWLNCIVYTKKEIVDFLGADSSLFSDYNSPTIRSFGYLISDRRFIYTIDPSSTPIASRGGMNVIETHVHNLMTPSTPLYFNTVYDPFVLGSDFTKGTPYSLRGGQPTAISHGLALGTETFDSLTNVAKGDIDTHGVSVAHGVTVSIPFGTLYSQSFLNLAFNREVLGVVMFPSVIEKDDPLSGMSEIINGWISKVIADIMGQGTKSGSPTVNRTSSLSNVDYADRLGGEFQGYFIQEEIINFFATIKLPLNKDSSELMQEVAKLIERDLSGVSAYLTLTASRMRGWQKRWDNHHAFMNTHVPVAAYSSVLGHRNATCAVLTITHNEKIMLPLWIRYYSRHVESKKDLYILDHNTNDGSTDNVPEGVVLLKLHGDQAGFPLAFMNR
jgi:reversibly glycosylated polypeptide / UDP-arabinopyranose mutase